MNVLVIDDQISVVRGLLKGINWEKLRITHVWTACSQAEAKEVILREHVDVMLCDIEMPGGDGLSLYAWVKEYDSSIECIFLTAHADFSFAKEALRLGSFDYILQPAPYAEVEEAISRVCQRMRIRIQEQRYSSYGQNFYENKELLLDGFLKEWFSGNKVDLEELFIKLEKLQIHLNYNTQAAYGIWQILRWDDEGRKIESGLMRYACMNILTELFEKYEIRVLSAALEAEQYALLFYLPDGQNILQEEVMGVLEEFLAMCKNFYGATGACYLGNFCQAGQLEEQIRKVLKLRFDNVAQQRGVFTSGRIIAAQTMNMEWMEKWHLELTGRKADKVREKAFQYLDSELDAEALQLFYMKFMQEVAAACDSIGISSYQIFQKKGGFEKSLVAYQSIDAVKWLIRVVTEFFEENTEKDDGNYVETVIQYIHRNLERDIRRSELAQVVNLNEDYLSRIFKKEKGMSLKEYILLEKMRMAQNLLRNTEFSIGMIGSKVGFGNFSHFSQMYKKVMGKTPAEERE